VGRAVSGQALPTYGILKNEIPGVGVAAVVTPLASRLTTAATLY